MPGKKTGHGLQEDTERHLNKYKDAAAQAQWPEPVVEATVKMELRKGEQLQQTIAKDEALWIVWVANSEGIIIDLAGGFPLSNKGA